MRIVSSLRFGLFYRFNAVIASAAKQPSGSNHRPGLLRRFAPRMTEKQSCRYHFSPNGRISISNVQALRGCW
jgi:hypothetical protein